MKKLLIVLSAVLVCSLSSCEKDNQVKPIDQVYEIESNMWMTGIQSHVEFIPKYNEMLVYGENTPFDDNEANELPIPTAFAYYLHNNGSAKINSDHLKFKLEGSKMTIGDNIFTKTKRVNTNIKDPLKEAYNILWGAVVNRRYSVEFLTSGDADITLSFIKEKGLVIMRHNEMEPVQCRRFNFKEDKLYLGNPDKEIGFILESYNEDKIILSPDDDSENLMILYPLTHS
ncbi:MAG: hypothetical protein MI866_08345 [Bacteroidales bacterium]|nr:hypothetical protein [Bacteroidales bacterium]